jgi:hypothetical protein
MLSQSITLAVVSMALMSMTASTLGESSWQTTGRLAGFVMDVNEAVIPGAVVVIEGLKSQQQVVSNEHGRYAVELPVGVYTVTTTVNGFYHSRRAPFRVQGGKQAFIDVRLIPTGVREDGLSTLPQIAYESFSPPNGSDTSLQLLIEYSVRQEKNGIIEYRGASITYDFLTVVADHASFDRARLRVEAEGNVIVQSGKESLRVKSAAVNFQARDPIVSLSTGVIESVSGEGWIESEGVSFRLDVTAPHTGYLVYRDRKAGITIESIGIHSFRVDDDLKSVVTFTGVGRVNGSLAVPFTVTVRDGAKGTGPDTFVIKFDGSALERNGRMGPLSRGDLLVRRSR